MAKQHLRLVSNQIAYRRKPGAYLHRPILTWYHTGTNYAWIARVGHSTKPNNAIKAAVGKMLEDESLQIVQVWNALDTLLAKITRTAAGDIRIRRYF